MLISMGDLVPRKNYPAAIRAIAKAGNPKLHYMICGRGPELENLQNLSKELGVENQIHFLGFRTDVKELLTGADIFLFTTRQEGLPRSMMEAMASGLPCVASAIRGNVDLIENGVNGFVCATEDVDGYADAIAKIVADPELREQMRQNNLEKIKNYDISVVEQQIREIYADVLKKD
jgi:glycosyltransferase involved in cell wall biosynthesis